MNTETLLQAIVDDLAQHTDAVSSRIGLEDNRSEQDFPGVRVVPALLSNEINSSGNRELDVHIYFGYRQNTETSLSQVYSKNCMLERQIDAQMKNGQWLATNKKTEMQYEGQVKERLQRSE